MFWNVFVNTSFATFTIAIVHFFEKARILIQAIETRIQMENIMNVQCT
mgnify:CR=1 FL=1